MRSLLVAVALLVPSATVTGPPPKAGQGAKRPLQSSDEPPPSLAATQVDRDGARRLFDYFLSAGGEEPTSSLRARIMAEAPRTGELLDRYLALGEAVRTLRADPSEDMDSRLQRLHDLRVAYLGEETAEAFFGLEEAEAQVSLARRRGVETPLSPAEYATILPVATMQKEVGLSPAEVHALRVATFGEAAAERLAALDREKLLRKPLPSALGLR